VDGVLVPFVDRHSESPKLKMRDRESKAGHAPAAKCKGFSRREDRWTTG
jgi:hypothetical protein